MVRPEHLDNIYQLKNKKQNDNKRINILQLFWWGVGGYWCVGKRHIIQRR